MNIKLEAVFAIEEQQKGKENTAVFMVGEQLKEIIKDNEHLSELVVQDLKVPEMSLVACEKKIKEYADKQKKDGNCVCVPPNAAENIIREFYGLSKEERSNNSQGVINLEDYFR